MHLRVLSFNLLGIPLISKNFDFRMKTIPLEVAKLAPDIVCFQEVWLTKIKEILVSEMRPFGYHYYAALEVGVKIKGGLLTFSKYGIRDLAFTKFINKSSFWGDRLMDSTFYKGFLDSRIIIGKEEISVINLHLSANYSDEFVRQNHYFQQVEEQVSMLIPYVEKISRNVPVILTGDFNLAPHSLFYNKLVHYLNLLDSMGAVQDPTELPCALIQTHRLSNRKISRRSDYIFIRRQPKTNISGQIVLNQKYKNPQGEEVYLSDHFGVLAEIFINETALKPKKGGKNVTVQENSGDQRNSG
ncbi:hypothetical protein CO181_00490 [candidate division WWE3 bacterium CG_4_9_14_3_um_filter_43_9]|uniref:Endonuclease/exonuclease/phosphatase domain-containing protein n=2 Tax=Katanobacteria TaxID=422282 RepID=A0A2M7TDQ9_UNCKA|nr:MAG: hypothetical protein COY34_00555 [candidate division WWE3 bacterium CG_4_10_14_0_2_um_filter_42_8]PJA38396.1 MAG: hypothetical protein CO181_00490 [candidate division WWE3 bacterium CG_4_9_14_3_um_filter_43_9]